MLLPATSRQGRSDAIGRVTVVEADGGRAEYLRIDDLEGLLAAVQVGTLELHVWGARADTIERPDRLVFDLDPDVGLQFAAVRDAAFEVKALLEELGLTSYRCSPAARASMWWRRSRPTGTGRSSKRSPREAARRLVDTAPDRYTTNLRKAARDGRIFVDWLRNQRGSTAIVPWSTRAKPNASVAIPLSWDELRRARRPTRSPSRMPTDASTAIRGPGYFELRQTI